MNICYLIRAFSNQAGTESYVYNMARTLAALGHRVHIVSLTGQGRKDFTGFEDKIFLHQLALEEVPFKGSRFLEQVFPLYAWRYGKLIGKILPGLVEKHSIDMIEATDWGTDAWAYSGERKVPVCVRLHGYPGFKDEFDRGIMKKWPKNRFLWSLFRKHLSSADLVTGVSEAYTGFVRKAWELKELDVKLIPISVDLSVFHPAEVPGEEQAIIFAGRLEKSKGIEVLAEAIPLILKKLPNTKFYLAGQDRERGDTPQTWSQYLIERFGTERIIYLGSLPTRELVHYYQTAAVCVVPSLYEPGGTAVFESMACGCPVIASRVGGLVEIVKDRRTGLLVPPAEAQVLADAAVELLQDPRMRRELSQNALEAIRKNFDIKSSARQALAAYARTIGSFKERKTA
ncbi:MAG: glycosyltransferase family 4 protein [Elusimicrobia bacterium]|nr:glycosyltransferase family 4 protein [Elusimicrobiota bacterium]